MQRNRILIILFLFISLLVLLFLLFGRQEYKFNTGKANMIEFFDKRIKNVIFDLGANIGDSALLFADPDNYLIYYVTLVCILSVPMFGPMNF
jgi:hypothetical protein